MLEEKDSEMSLKKIQNSALWNDALKHLYDSQCLIITMTDPEISIYIINHLERGIWIECSW